MRHIERLPEPDILHEKHDEWQRKYEEKLQKHPSARPDHSKYAHPAIAGTLQCMSHGKCFYCETRLSGAYKEIDHHIEVFIDPSKAYDWTNLYLACDNCNNKLNHYTIPVSEALNPCRNSDEEIQQALTFDGEMIGSMPNSQLGLKTIQKYKLDTALLDLRRSRHLRFLCETVDKIKDSMLESGRRTATDEEKNQIRAFMQADRPYSLMCQIYINRHYAKLLAD